MKQAIEFLRTKGGKYRKLISRWESEKENEIAFELLFANQCEADSISLNYEVSINGENSKTVDFQIEVNDHYLNIELFRMGVNKGIRELTRENGVTGYCLTSNNSDPSFRTGAQIIKLQEGILEKVEKFPSEDAGNVNLICVDCSNVHAGMLDCHDVAITMWGKPYNPIWVERWEGDRIMGMLEKGYSKRNSDAFRKRISAVIFVKELQYNPLNKAYIAFNNLRGVDHIEKTLNALKECDSFTKIGMCKQT